MAVMPQSWTDERLDDFRAEVGHRFDAVDQRFDRVEREIQGLRVEMRTEFVAIRGDAKAESTALRGEMRNEFAALRREMKEEFAAVRSEMKAGFDRLDRLITRMGFGVIAALIVAVLSSHL